MCESPRRAWPAGDVGVRRTGGPVECVVSGALSESEYGHRANPVIRGRFRGRTTSELGLYIGAMLSFSGVRQGLDVTPRSWCCGSRDDLGTQHSDVSSGDDQACPDDTSLWTDCGQRRRSTATTLPTMRAWSPSMGEKSLLAGSSFTWPFLRWKVLTVASSSSIAATMSPLTASG